MINLNLSIVNSLESTLTPETALMIISTVREEMEQRPVFWNLYWTTFTYIGQNASAVFQSVSWLLLPPDTVEVILRSDGLCCTEKEVVAALRLWGSGDNLQHLPKLKQHIRLVWLSKEDLRADVGWPVFTAAEREPFLVHLLDVKRKAEGIRDLKRRADISEGDRTSITIGRVILR